MELFYFSPQVKEYIAAYPRDIFFVDLNRTSFSFDLENARLRFLKPFCIVLI
jgi:hypothetical protein